MYGKVKLTKRQIKEDKFTAFMLNAKHQFMENWQYFIIGLIIVILLITAVVYYLDNQKAQEVEVSKKYVSAIQDYRGGESQMAILGLTQIVEENPGSIIAEQSLFLLGKFNLELRNYSEAERYFNMFIDKYPDNSQYTSASKAGIATGFENQGQYNEAAVAFGAAYDLDPNGPMTGDYQYGAMRNYLLAGDFENALIHLNKIKELFSGTDFENRATRLFKENQNN
jgi:outer membrane protein assembly factor BamD (BamD/ComL family)